MVINVFPMALRDIFGDGLNQAFTSVDTFKTVFFLKPFKTAPSKELCHFPFPREGGGWVAWREGVQQVLICIGALCSPCR